MTGFGIGKYVVLKTCPLCRNFGCGHCYGYGFIYRDETDDDIAEEEIVEYSYEEEM